jgi:hypothetical protein
MDFIINQIVKYLNFLFLIVNIIDFKLKNLLCLYYNEYIF